MASKRYRKNQSLVNRVLDIEDKVVESGKSNSSDTENSLSTEIEAKNLEDIFNEIEKVKSELAGNTLTFDSTPAGTIVAWGASSAPNNWLICDGSAVSRGTYSTLFSVIGTSYGSGDGSTTFNLPDLRGRVPVGLDVSQSEFDALNGAGGAKTHTLTVAQTPRQDVGLVTTGGAYQSTVAVSDSAAGSVANRHTLATGSGGGLQTIKTAGTGQSHNNLQPYRVVNFIIKHTAALTPEDSDLEPRVLTLENDAEDTGWITPTLSGGASNEAGNPVQYRRKAGIVYFRGRLAGASFSSGTVVFTLPAGFRPDGNTSQNNIFIADSNGYTRINIPTDTGAVTIASASPTGLLTFPFSFIAAS